MEIKVIYIEEIYSSNVKISKIHSENKFLSIEDAKIAPFPHNCVFAYMKVEDGAFVYDNRFCEWQFVAVPKS